jgi:hypothetical protein
VTRAAAPLALAAAGLVYTCTPAASKSVKEKGRRKEGLGAGGEARVRRVRVCACDGEVSGAGTTRHGTTPHYTTPHDTTQGRMHRGCAWCRREHEEKKHDHAVPHA